MSKKVLEMTLISTSENTFDVEIYEPESGEFKCVNCHDSGSGLDEENSEIIKEIRSWVSIMRES